MAKKHFKTITAVILAASALLFYAFFPLEWGLMDDTEYVFAIRKHLNEELWLRAVLARITEHMNLDLQAGILRPSFWWYTALAYQLPVRIAYLTRFIEYFSILFIGFSLIQSNLVGAPYNKKIIFGALSVTALLSIRSLYDGIALFSLQEFTGLFFLMLGYWTYGLSTDQKISSLRLLAAIILISLGVGFKPPFVWIFFLFSFSLFYFERRRIVALLLFLFGIFYFYFAIKLAQNGFYSREIYQFNPHRFLISLYSFLKHFSPALIILIGMSFTFGLWRKNGSLSVFGFGKIKNRPTRIDWIGIQLFLSGAAYLVTLLPRGIGPGYGYYFGAPIFLITLGFLIYSSRYVTSEKLDLKKASRITLPISIGIAAFILYYSISSFVARNLAIHHFKLWARENDSSEIVLATNSSEVAFRLKEILFLRNEKPWNGKIENLIFNMKVPKEITHYLVFSDQVSPQKEAIGNLIWQHGSASLYEVPQNIDSTAK